MVWCDPMKRNLISIVNELRRLNRTITVPLERDLKRAGCPALESYEVLREIDQSGDVQPTPAELQARLAVPQRRMSSLIDGLVKDGYVERKKPASDARGHFVVITDSGRRALRTHRRSCQQRCDGSSMERGEHERPGNWIAADILRLAMVRLLY
jgi:DNA-binding MarR family transcriptional regulator